MQYYKHKQIGYLMIVVTLAVIALFVWVYASALAEQVSIDSGPNLLVTSVMVLIVLILASFTTLTITVDEQNLRIKFGYGIFSKSFTRAEITSVRTVKNRWYYGWGVKVWFWPYMWIYSISGFDAVELTMRNGRIYRIGTDEPAKLEAALTQVLY